MTPAPDPGARLPVWHAALVPGPALGAGTAALSLAAVLSGSQGAGHGLRADASAGSVMLLVASIGWSI